MIFFFVSFADLVLGVISLSNSETSLLFARVRLGCDKVHIILCNLNLDD